MLKRVTGRRFSKTAQLILVIIVTIIVIGVIIMMFIRPPQKPINTGEPLGTLKQSREINLT
jgi:phosphotransferase system  glucose/maltose/N-acetylglucosamine-specific IIC component